jgi:hypothetical protein
MSSLLPLQIDLVDEVSEGLPWLADPEVCYYTLKRRKVVTAVRKVLSRIHVLTGV